MQSYYFFFEIYICLKKTFFPFTKVYENITTYF